MPIRTSCSVPVPPKAVLQRLRDLLRAVGRVPVAREVDQAGDEPAVVVTALEQPHLPAVLQLEDARGDLEQLVGVDLEQLVAGIGLEDLAQGAAAVALGPKAGPIEHLGHLVPQQGDVEHAVAVDVGVVEAEEPPLTDHLPVAVELLDPDVGQVVGPAHRAAAVGGGQHQHRRRQDHPPGLRCDVGEPVRLLGPTPVAEQAEAGPGRDDDQILVGRFVDEVVLAVAEEHEVVVAQPPQELRGAGGLAGPERQHGVLQLVRQLIAPVPHRTPVRHRHPDVVEGVHQPLPQQLLAGAVAAVHLQVHPRLVGRALLQALVAAVLAGHAEHRVDHQVDAEADRGHDHPHGVDQERHVVGDDLDDGVGGLPARPRPGPG